MSGLFRSQKTIILALLAVGAAFLVIGPKSGIRPWDREVAFVAGAGGFSAEGSVTKYQSTVKFDPAAPQDALIHLLLDMRSTTTGFSAADKVALSEDFLDVERFPTAELKAKGAKPAGDNVYIMDAELTLKGVTKPVQVPFLLLIKDGAPVLRGSATVNRLDFNVGEETYRGYALDKDVKLKFAVVADKLDNDAGKPKLESAKAQ